MLITLRAVEGFTGLTNQQSKSFHLACLHAHPNFAAFFREEEQGRNTILKKESLMKRRWISLGLWEYCSPTPPLSQHWVGG